MRPATATQSLFPQHQLPRQGIVLFNNQRQLPRQQHAIINHLPAVDDAVGDALRSAEDEGGDGVDKGAGHGDIVGAEGDDVGAVAGLDAAQHVAAAEHVGTAAGGDVEGFAGAHGGRIFIANAGREHSLAGFVEQVVGVVGGAAVHTQTDLHTSVAHLANRGDAGGQPHVGAGAVGDAGAGAGEQGNTRVVQMHAVGVPDVVANPADRFGVFGRGHAVALLAEGEVLGVLGGVGVQANAAGARQCRTFAHQVGGHGKG